MLLYLFYLVPFDWGYQKGHMFSFFVFCPRTIMEFLSVFFSSEDIISGLNKWKNTIKSNSGQKSWLCFQHQYAVHMYPTSKLHPKQLPPLQFEIPKQMLSKYLWQHPRKDSYKMQHLAWSHNVMDGHKHNFVESNQYFLPSWKRGGETGG